MAVSILALSAACSAPANPAASKKMIVLGVDGMDPGFLERHFEALPNLNRLRREGEFKRLGTTIPPQSPVAWSSFITGMDPGGHGVFDFLHRRPSTRLPFSSMAEASESARPVTIGPCVIPLSGGSVRLLRNGRAFWEILSEHGIPATVIKIPNNFPPVRSGARSLSGMGTPDLEGTYGTFSYFTDDPKEARTGVAGGRIERIRVEAGRTVISVRGPVNSFRKDRRLSAATFTLHLDAGSRAARIDIQDGSSLILLEGEWSDWIRVRFRIVPGLKRVAGMFRLYLREIHPVLRLYASPVSIDPLEPELPISTPENLSRELAETLGLFHTLGNPEDTSALRAGVLDHREYLAQSRGVLAESLRLFDHELERFASGFFFHYFSGLDQNSHVLWGRREPDLLEFCRAVDAAVGRAVIKAAGGTTLIVMSDHGFASFERAVHLNTWLMKEGYLALDDPRNVGRGDLFAHVAWPETQAYALGLNGLYLNLKRREADGRVAPGPESERLLKDLIGRLREFRDPDSGRLVVQSVYRPGEVYRGSDLRYAPDLIIGYAPGYRSSWQTALGGIPDLVVEDNSDAWIADHCIAAEAVPGVFLSNRRSAVRDPMLWDLTATILQEFGIRQPAEMIGRPLFD